MALSASTNRVVRPRDSAAFEVADAEVTFAGSYACLHSESFATAADRGFADVFQVAAGIIPLPGWFRQDVTGDTSATIVPENNVFMDGSIEEKATVTGVSAQEDVGKLVYQSDDDTLTLTRPAQGIPSGFITRFYSSTTCDVMRFDAGELGAIALAGGGKYTWMLGGYITTTATGNLATGITAPHHGKFVDFYAIVKDADAGTGGDVDINLEIGGANVSGGVINIVGTNAVAEKVSGTAITGANIFSEGDLIDIEIVQTGAPAAGSEVNLFVEVETMMGI